MTAGVSAVADLVEVTYGPGGSVVMAADAAGKLLVTRDGSAVARRVQLSGLGRIGAGLVTASASRADANAGDGTSTMLIITSALLKGALRSVTAGADPTQLARELVEAADTARQRLQELVTPATEELLRRVALIASHGDLELAQKVVEAVESAGEGGAVTLVADVGVGLALEQRAGYVTPSGWYRPPLTLTNGALQLEGPLVALVRSPLRAPADVHAMMEAATQWPGRALLVFGSHVSGGAAAMLRANDAQGLLHSMAVPYAGNPGHFDLWMDTLAALTGATVVNANSGMRLQDFKGEWLGAARSATVRADRTELVAYDEAARWEALELRARQLRHLADRSPSEADADRWREEAAALSGGLCRLKVGGPTEAVAQERRARAEDVLHSVRAALSGGLVPGAGHALYWASQALPDTDGGRLLRAAMARPRSLLARGPLPDSYDPWVGWDPVAGALRPLCNDPAVVDAYGVVAEALKTAVSTAATLIPVGGLISLGKE